MRDYYSFVLVITIAMHGLLTAFALADVATAIREQKRHPTNPAPDAGERGKP